MFDFQLLVLKLLILLTVLVATMLIARVLQPEQIFLPSATGTIPAVTNINTTTSSTTINFTHHVDFVDELDKYVELTLAVAGGESDATAASDGTQKTGHQAPR